MSVNRLPNVVFIFADEWRAQATGYNGDTNCETPTLDALSRESLNITHAVSGSSVCSPYRASLMTGQYPLSHGVYINDVELDPTCLSLARAFRDGGYQTAYIGKWHLHGSPDGRYGRRETFVPRASQLGFDYWKGFECNHDYNNSHYFFNDDPVARTWDGYDAKAQNRDAAEYIAEHADDEEPFLLVLSWGPPHFPLDSAPTEYSDRYWERKIGLRPNVPETHRNEAISDLRGYYAHIAALDDCLRIVVDAIHSADIDQNTILVFTSDHGDMRGSQGLETKCYPWDESIRVPFLLRWPALGRGGAKLAAPVDAPDIMPTLLRLCSLPIPPSLEGRDWSSFIRGTEELTGDEAALLTMPAAFFRLRMHGMQPYRGLRSSRYTYVRNLDGPWLLYDNEQDPYQMRNLIGTPEHRDLQARLEDELQGRLDGIADEFLAGEAYLKRDELSHYEEANYPIGASWADPWTRTRDGGRLEDETQG